MGINSDPSDSEESDDDDIEGTINAQPVEIYNPKDFEDLEVSIEVKELFQNIMRYLLWPIHSLEKSIPILRFKVNKIVNNFIANTLLSLVGTRHRR